MANTQFGTFTVTDAAKKVIDANTNRKGFNLFNNSVVTIFWGFTSALTILNGIPIPANAGHFNTGREDGYRGSVFVIVASDTANLRFQEWGL